MENSELMDRAVDVEFVSHMPTQTSTTRCQMDLVKAKSYSAQQLVPVCVFQKGIDMYSHAVDNVIMTNSRIVQLEPQQVSGVDMGHTKRVMVY